MCSASAAVCTAVVANGCRNKLAIKGDVKQEFNDVTLTYLFMNNS